MGTLRAQPQSEQKVYASADLSEEETRHETSPCSDERESSTDMRTTSVETEVERQPTAEDEEELNGILLNPARKEPLLPVGEDYGRTLVPSRYLLACSKEADTPVLTNNGHRSSSAAGQIHAAHAALQQHEGEGQHVLSHKETDKSGVALRAERLCPEDFNKVALHPNDFRALASHSADVSINYDAVNQAYLSGSKFPSVDAFLGEEVPLPPAYRGLPEDATIRAQQGTAAPSQQVQQRVQVQQSRLRDEVRTGDLSSITGHQEAVPSQRLSPFLLAQLERSQGTAARLHAGGAGPHTTGDSYPRAASGGESYPAWLAGHNDMVVAATCGGRDTARFAEDDEVSFDLSSTDDWGEESGGCFLSEGNSSSEKATVHAETKTEEPASEPEVPSSRCENSTVVRTPEANASASSSSGSAEDVETASMFVSETDGDVKATTPGSRSHTTEQLLQHPIGKGFLQTDVKDGSVVEKPSPVTTRTLSKEPVRGPPAKSCVRHENKTVPNGGQQDCNRPGGPPFAAKQDPSSRADMPTKRKIKRQQLAIGQKQQRPPRVSQSQTVQPQETQTRPPQRHQQHGSREEPKVQLQQQHVPGRSQFAVSQLQTHAQKQHQQSRKQQAAVEKAAPADAATRGPEGTAVLAAETAAQIAETASKGRTARDTEMYSCEVGGRDAAAAPRDLISSPIRSLPSAVTVSRGRSPLTRRVLPTGSHPLQQPRDALAKSQRVSSWGSSKSSTSNSSPSSTRSPPARLQATQILKAISRTACGHAEKKRSGRGPCWNDLPPAAQRKILEVVQQQRSLITSRAQIRKAVEAMQRAVFNTSSSSSCAFTGNAKSKHAASTHAKEATGSTTSGTATAETTGESAAESSRHGWQERKRQDRREGWRQPGAPEEKAKSLPLRKGILSGAGGARGYRGHGCTYVRRLADGRKASGTGEFAEGKRKNGFNISGTTAASRSPSAASRGGNKGGGGVRPPSARSSHATAGLAHSPSAVGGSAGVGGAPASVSSVSGHHPRGRKAAERREKQRSSTWHHLSRRLGASYSVHSLQGSNSGTSGSRLLCPHGLRYKSLCAHCGSSVLLQLHQHGTGNSGAAADAGLHFQSKAWDRRARSCSRTNKQYLAGREGCWEQRSSSNVKRMASSAGCCGIYPLEKGENPVFERLWNHALNKQRALSDAALRRRNSSTHSTKAAVATTTTGGTTAEYTNTSVGKRTSGSTADYTNTHGGNGTSEATVGYTSTTVGRRESASSSFAGHPAPAAAVAEGVVKRTKSKCLSQSAPAALNLVPPIANTLTSGCLSFSTGAAATNYSAAGAAIGVEVGTATAAASSPSGVANGGPPDRSAFEGSDHAGAAKHNKYPMAKKDAAARFPSVSTEILASCATGFAGSAGTAPRDSGTAATTTTSTTATTTTTTTATCTRSKRRVTATGENAVNGGSVGARGGRGALAKATLGAAHAVQHVFAASVAAAEHSRGDRQGNYSSNYGLTAEEKHAAADVALRSKDIEENTGLQALQKAGRGRHVVVDVGKGTASSSACAKMSTMQLPPSAGSSASLPFADCPVRQNAQESVGHWQQQDQQRTVVCAPQEQQLLPDMSDHERQTVETEVRRQKQQDAHAVVEKILEPPLHHWYQLAAANGVQQACLHRKAEEQQQQRRRQQDMFLTAVAVQCKENQPQQKQQQPNSPVLIYNYAVPSPLQPQAPSACQPSDSKGGIGAAAGLEPARAIATPGEVPFLRGSHTLLYPSVPHRPPSVVCTGIGPLHSTDVKHNTHPFNMQTAASSMQASTQRLHCISPGPTCSPLSQSVGVADSSSSSFASPAFSAVDTTSGVTTAAAAGELGPTALDKSTQEKRDLEQQQRLPRQASSLVVARGNQPAGDPDWVHASRSEDEFPQGGSRPPLCSRRQHPGDHGATDDVFTMSGESRRRKSVQPSPAQQPPGAPMRAVTQTKTALQQQQKEAKDQEQEQPPNRQQQQQRLPDLQHRRGLNGVETRAFKGKTTRGSAASRAASTSCATAVRRELQRSREVTEANALSNDSQGATAYPNQQQQRLWQEVHLRPEGEEHVNSGGSAFVSVGEATGQAVDVAEHPDNFSEERNSISTRLSNLCIQDLRIETRPMPHAGASVAPRRSFGERCHGSEKRNTGHGLHISSPTSGMYCLGPAAPMQLEEDRQPWQQQRNRGTGLGTEKQQQRHEQRRSTGARPVTRTVEEKNILGAANATRQQTWQQAWQQQQRRWRRQHSPQARPVWQQQPQWTQEQPLAQQQQHCVAQQHPQQYEREDQEQSRKQPWQQQLWSQIPHDKTQQQHQEGNIVYRAALREHQPPCNPAYLQQQQQHEEAEQHLLLQRERMQQQRVENRHALPGGLDTPVAAHAHHSVAPNFICKMSQDYEREQNIQAINAPAGARSGLWGNSSINHTLKGHFPARGWPEAAAALADCLAEEAAQEGAYYIRPPDYPRIFCPEFNSYAGVQGIPATRAGADGFPTYLALNPQQHQFLRSRSRAAAREGASGTAAAAADAVCAGFLRRRRSRSRYSEGSTSSPSCADGSETTESNQNKKGLAGWFPFLMRQQ